MSTPIFAPSSHDPEAFYEDYVQHHVPYHLNPAGFKGWILRFLPYWSWREWRFWNRCVPRGGVLLDLGCARGREVFAARSQTSLGLDISPTALRECAKHYHLATRSNLFPVPFRDGSVDCVVTSHVLGHVPADQKDRVLSEITRVLKPGGKSIHVVETDSLHPLVKFAKQHPDLYQQYFVEPDGHIGLEMPSAVVERFERHGLRLVRCYKMDAGVFHPRLMLKHFDNELRRYSAKVDRMVRLSAWMMNRPVVLELSEVLLGIHHYSIGQWICPLEHAQFVAVVLEKPARLRT